VDWLPVLHLAEVIQRFTQRLIFCGQGFQARFCYRMVSAIGGSVTNKLYKTQDLRTLPYRQYLNIRIKGEVMILSVHTNAFQYVRLLWAGVSAFLCLKALFWLWGRYQEEHLCHYNQLPNGRDLRPCLMLLLFCKRQQPELVERMRTSTPKQGPLCVLCPFWLFCPQLLCVWDQNPLW
jgi:hypothetical protein